MCGSHNLQLQLSNPAKDLIGEGAVDALNVMQMLHCACDLQESLNWIEFVEMLEIATDHVEMHLEDAFVGPLDQEAQVFLEKFNKAKHFRDFANVDALWPLKDDGSKSFRRIPQAILTRWWHVGEAAKVVWHGYPLLFRMTQVVINVCGSNSRPGKIASVMQVRWSYLALVVCYQFVTHVVFSLSC